MAIETMLDLLDCNSQVDREICYLSGDGAVERIAYRAQRERALAVLGHLQHLGAGRGDRLILLLDDNPSFIDGFWAAVAGGIAAVPLSMGSTQEHLHKILRVVRQLEAPYLHTSRRHFNRLRDFAVAAGASALLSALAGRTCITDEIDPLASGGRPASLAPTDLALIQFSSGSTGDPKGIPLSHRNILANCKGVSTAARFHSDDISLSWMPLTHDMGLIGFHIFMFANRMRIHHMPTELFVRRPLAWMQYASNLKVTLTSSPNFGYRHYLRALAGRHITGLDLSAVRLVFNGAEPISAALCEEFIERMAPHGLRRSAMFPAYGLAEASLAVSFPEVGCAPNVASVDRTSLGVGERAKLVTEHDRNAVRLVSVGRPISGMEVQVALADGSTAADGAVGHLRIRGDSVTSGDVAMHTAMQSPVDPFQTDGWLDTGDLAVVLAGQLYITGRSKEVIFVNGQNHYPQDLETIAHRVLDIEFGRIAAAGCRQADAEADEVVVFVVHRGALADFLRIEQEVKRVINEQAGVEVKQVVRLAHMPKTTSGKLQRGALAQSFCSGQFDAGLEELRRLRRASDAPAEAAVERRLKEICSAALEMPIQSPNVDLFEIGTESMALAQVHSAIEAHYPGIVTVSDLFDHPTIGRLAECIRTRLSRQQEIHH